MWQHEDMFHCLHCVTYYCNTLPKMSCSFIKNVQKEKERTPKKQEPMQFSLLGFFCLETCLIAHCHTVFSQYTKHSPSGVTHPIVCISPKKNPTIFKLLLPPSQCSPFSLQCTVPTCWNAWTNSGSGTSCVMWPWWWKTRAFGPTAPSWPPVVNTSTPELPVSPAKIPSSSCLMRLVKKSSKSFKGLNFYLNFFVSANRNVSMVSLHHQAPIQVYWIKRELYLRDHLQIHRYLSRYDNVKFAASSSWETPS